MLLGCRVYSRALKYTGHFSGPQGLGVENGENMTIFLDIYLNTINIFRVYPLSSKIFFDKIEFYLTCFWCTSYVLFVPAWRLDSFFCFRWLEDS